MVDSERVLASAVIDAVASRGGAITFADIGHLFGSTEADGEWERLLPSWCDPPFTLAELEELVRPVVRSRVDALPLMPGVVELVGAAGEVGWAVAVATGQGRDRLEPNLSRLGVLERFDAIVTAVEVPRGKPAPDIFLEVARRVGVAPAECVVLEDSLPGCHAALAAGMIVVACPSVVSAHLEFPAGVRRVATLAGLGIDELIEVG